jgi:hypothetical protein
MLTRKLLILLLAPLALTAQKKVDLDKFTFTAQYRSLPAMRIDSTYRTYNVEIESTKLMQPFMQDLTPEKLVELEGWRKMPHDGHLNIKVQIDDLLPEGISVKERVEEIKDKTGKVTGTRTFYSQEMTYTFAATAIITDYKGIHIMDQQLYSRQNKQVYRSPEFQLKPIADGYFALNAIKVTGDLYRKNVNQALRNLSNNLTNNFGFSEVTVTDYMWIIDSRKHPEYEAHRNAFKQLSNILFTMDANTPTDGMREQLKPVIQYFESIKKYYPSNSKHDRKIRYASYFNLAVLYYNLDDPQNMMKEAKGLVLNDYDARDGQGFEQTALRLKNQFLLTNIHSRHFRIDINSKGLMKIRLIISDNVNFSSKQLLLIQK